MTNIKLKPCPFCGSDAAYSEPSEIYPDYHVYCPTCHISTLGYATLEIAMKRWNRRDERTAKWLVDGGSDYMCNNCLGISISETDYCPFCGSRME